ncbi:MAG: hypothetical protein ACKOOG_14415 [Actinomycetota bacterium]
MISEARLVAGTATGVGSLPHSDPHAAAALVLRLLPELPPVPELPKRDPREGLVARSVSAIEGVRVAPDGTVGLVAPVGRSAPVRPDPDDGAHTGLAALLDAIAVAPHRPRSVKVQTAGPLTLGLALVTAGVAPAEAFPLAARVASAWIAALEDRVATALPDTGVLAVLDEPALVVWREHDGPIPRDEATDVLSSVLAGIRATAGVHVCGAGDLRLALDAGPRVVHFDAAAFDLDDAAPLGRFLDAGGWVAWGAVPTHGPVGEHPQPLWKALVETWCELTQRGCDSARLRTQALVAPACGLAGHGVSQAERALGLAHDIGARVHYQVAAARLSVGA